MKLVKILTLDNAASKKSEVYELPSGRFEVFNMIGEQISRGFPNKDYASVKSATKYANKFLNYKG